MLCTLLALLLVVSAGASHAQKKAATTAPVAVPPVVVQVEKLPQVQLKVDMPSKPHEIYFTDILIPVLSGLVSGAAVILGIYLTNRNNQKENAANRLHSEHRWRIEREAGIKKEVLFVVVKRLVLMHDSRRRLDTQTKSIMDSEPPTSADEVQKMVDNAKRQRAKAIQMSQEAFTEISISDLCLSPELAIKIKECNLKINSRTFDMFDEAAALEEARMIEEIIKLGRKELFA